MDDNLAPEEAFESAVGIEAPAPQLLAMVFASPHSGSTYPPAFLAQSALDAVTLRRSEDSFVDELFACAPRRGAPLIKALFPRAFLDPNREPFELDPAMFEDPLPDHVSSDTPRVQAGLGTIARLVSSGAEIYKTKLTFAQAERRVERLYRPYHTALERLMATTEAQFGHCLLVDCHSMPSTGGPSDSDAGLSRVDVVLGDCFGTTCSPRVTQCAESTLNGLGYVVVRNMPYSGGFTTRHYGAPAKGRHALQIELNRSLYMDEATHQKTAGFQTLCGHLDQLVDALAHIPGEALAR